MSNRASKSNALVLSLKEFGEGHRNAVLLLPESEGGCKIINASVYGGPKSKLRGLVVPYQTGEVWLYSNPIKNSTKINDFKVKEYRSGIRDNLARLWSASLASELAIKLEGNIDWNLINFFLTGISNSDETQCRLAVLRFVWRVIIFSGIAPDITSCTYCDEIIQDSRSLFYLPLENACVCSLCIGSNSTFFKLSKESYDYLFAIQNLSPKISRNIQLSESSYSELKQFLFYLIQATTNKPLKTLQTGSFIF